MFHRELRKGVCALRILFPLSLASAVLFALPAPAEESAPAADADALTIVAGGTVGGTGGRTSIRVTGKAALPDESVLVVSVFYGTRLTDDPAVAEHNATVRRGAYEEDFTDADAELLPGDYIVTVRVAEPQPVAVRRRFPPARRGLKGEAHFVLGGRGQVCAYVNKLSAETIRLSREIRGHYPALAEMLKDAWAQKLNPGQWKQWKAASPLYRAHEALFNVLLTRGFQGLMPKSNARAHTLMLEVKSVTSNIDVLLSGTKNGEILAAIREKTLPSEPDVPVPTISGLHATMFHEGLSIYAGSGGRVFEEIDAAYAARVGKGRAGWNPETSGRGIEELSKLLDDFAAIPWVVEGVDRQAKILSVKELYGWVRSYAAECGNALDGKADAASQVRKLRDDIAQRLVLLKDLAPPN